MKDVQAEAHCEKCALFLPYRVWDAGESLLNIYQASQKLNVSLSPDSVEEGS